MGVKKMLEKKLEILNIAQNINAFQIFAFVPILFKQKIKKTIQGSQSLCFIFFYIVFVNEALISLKYTLADITFLTNEFR